MTSYHHKWLERVTAVMKNDYHFLGSTGSKLHYQRTSEIRGCYYVYLFIGDADRGEETWVTSCQLPRLCLDCSSLSKLFVVIKTYRGEVSYLNWVFIHHSDYILWTRPPFFSLVTQKYQTLQQRRIIETRGVEALRCIILCPNFQLPICQHFCLEICIAALFIEILLWACHI